jgi:hypothetical protein
LGGVVSNLYDSFNGIGEIFFTFLIGGQRASRSELQDTRVRAGGFLVFSLIGTIFFLFLFHYNQTEWFKDEWGPLPLLLLAMLCGLGTGLFIGTVFVANILISYAHGIEREIERERQEAELETRREKYRDELIAKGMAPSEAQIRAQQMGSGCGAILVIAIVLMIVISASFLL